MFSIGNLEWVLSTCRTLNHPKVLTLFTFMLGIISVKDLLSLYMLHCLFIQWILVLTSTRRTDSFFCKDYVEGI